MAHHQLWNLDGANTAAAVDYRAEPSGFQQNFNLANLNPSPTIAGFTPINMLSTAQATHEPVDSQLQNPDRATISRAKGKKRVASQLGTPPATAKKSRKGSQPNSSRWVDGSPSNYQDVSKRISVTNSSGLSPYDDDPKENAVYALVNPKPDYPVTPRVRTGLSTLALNKLASYRYQAEPGLMIDSLISLPYAASTPDAENLSIEQMKDHRLDYGTDDICASSEHHDCDSKIVHKSHMPTKFSKQVSNAVTETTDCVLLEPSSHVTEELPSFTVHTDCAIDSARPVSSSCYGSLDSIVSRLLFETLQPDLIPLPVEGLKLGANGRLHGTVQAADHAEIPSVTIDCGDDMQNKSRTRRTLWSNDDSDSSLAASSSPKYPGAASEEESETDEAIDEKELEVASQLPTVNEPFEPPADLQLPFDDNSQTNEVYDPRLQFSSPSPANSVGSNHVDGRTIQIGDKNTIDSLWTTTKHSSFGHKLHSSCPIDDENHDKEIRCNSQEEDLLADDIDSDLIELADRASRSTYQTLLTPFQASSTPKLQWRVPTIYKSTQSSPAQHVNLAPQNDIVVQEQSISPALLFKQTSPLPKHIVAFDSNGTALPFARPPFPAQVQHRSPILGLSSSPLLRTCFRIGEALNAATLGLHTKLDPLIELYAQVMYSRRVGVEQHFQFGDLFRSDKPPYLNGSYVGWKGSELWDCDTKCFLGESGKGKVARCVGRMKKDGIKWRMLVHNIWEATFEDVGHVKGIVCV